MMPIKVTQTMRMSGYDMKLSVGLVVSAHHINPPTHKLKPPFMI